MKRELHIIKPATKANNFEIELIECIQKLKGFVADNIISFSVFFYSKDKIQYDSRMLRIEKELSDINLSQIPFSIISQAPAETSIVIELLYSQEDVNIERKTWQDTNYSLIKHNYGTELIVAGIGKKSNSNSFRDKAETAFLKISNILKLENFNQEHIVRQWSYIENILELKSENDQQLQNYQLFNEARNLFYSGKQLPNGYPAATGIGMKYGGLLIDFIAWKPISLTQIYPIDNPNQIASYHYGQDVLVGTTKELKQKSPPGFERGKLICANGLTTLYVSGTASILGENTVGHNDIKKQTITTINNINLIQKEAAQKQNRNFSEANQLKHIRVYIKEQKDFQLIKEICTKAYGEIPIVYVIADVCRQDLLIEIEAEYGN